jgi:hypothetical protein
MQHDNKENDRKAGRSDRPSGRQASSLPEHDNDLAREAETLHQGSGPELQTQDPELRKKNEGIQSLNMLRSDNRIPTSRDPNHAKTQKVSRDSD